MLKKLISLALVLCMVLSFSVGAFATNTTINQGTNADPIPNSGTFQITKEYQVQGTSPKETFTFTSKASASNPAMVNDKDELEIEDAEFDSLTENKKLELDVTLPKYEKVGTYVYTISENESDNAGVETADNITVTVQVVNQTNPDGTIKPKTDFVCYVNVYNAKYGYSSSTPTANKTEGFVDNSDGSAEGGDELNNANKYKAGTLEITKNVNGANADTSEYFAFNIKLTGDSTKIYQTMKVTGGSKLTDGLTAGTEKEFTFGTDGTAEVTVYLKHGETAKIENIPYNVTYTVTENMTDAQKALYTEVKEEAEDTDKVNGKTLTIDSTKETYTVTNKAPDNINTGISLDTIPYIALMLVATAGLAVVLTKKRGSEN